MKEIPKVSIGIPTFNRADLLSDAIESVLNQTYKNLEIIVSDNGSVDHTKKVVEYYQKISDLIPIRYKRFEETVPMHENWNKPLLSSKATYFGWLQDDDLLFPDFVEHAVEQFEKDKHLKVYTCYAQYAPEPLTESSLSVWGPPFRLNMANCESLTMKGYEYIPFAIFDTTGFSPVALFSRESLVKNIEYVGKEYGLCNERMIVIQTAMNDHVTIQARIGGLYRSHSNQLSYLVRDKQEVERQLRLYYKDLDKIYNKLGDKIWNQFNLYIKRVDSTRLLKWERDFVSYKNDNPLNKKASKILSSYIDSKVNKNIFFYISEWGKNINKKSNLLMFQIYRKIKRWKG